MDFYEVTGQGKQTKHMKVVGPRGTVARARGAPPEQKCSRGGVAGKGDKDGEWGYHRIKDLKDPTEKSDPEIEDWIKKWVEDNPAYNVLAIKGRNCQDFCREFYRWLTGESLGRVPQASRVKRATRVTVEVVRGVVEAVVPSEIVGQVALLDSVGAVVGEVSKAGALAVGAGLGDAARVGLAAGLGSSMATGAVMGGVVAGPAGAAGGAVLGAGAHSAGNVYRWGSAMLGHHMGLATGESLTIFEGELRMNESIKFEKDSTAHKVGVTAIEFSGPQSWQVISGMVWNRTLWVTTTRPAGVEFWTKGGYTAKFTAPLAGYRNRRWWADTDDQATVTKIRVTFL